jgi:hypothetical protein
MRWSFYMHTYQSEKGNRACRVLVRRERVAPLREVNVRIFLYIERGIGLGNSPCQYKIFLARGKYYIYPRGLSVYSKITLVEGINYHTIPTSLASRKNTISESASGVVLQEVSNIQSSIEINRILIYDIYKFQIYYSTGVTRYTRFLVYYANKFNFSLMNLIRKCIA